MLFEFRCPLCRILTVYLTQSLLFSRMAWGSTNGSASRDAMTRWIALVRNHCVLVRQPENIPEQLLNIPEAYLALEANNEASEKTA